MGSEVQWNRKVFRGKRHKEQKVYIPLHLLLFSEENILYGSSSGRSGRPSHVALSHKSTALRWRVFALSSYMSSASSSVQGCVGWRLDVRSFGAALQRGYFAREDTSHDSSGASIG
jgi:hypothetical protein